MTVRVFGRRRRPRPATARTHESAGSRDEQRGVCAGERDHRRGVQENGASPRRRVVNVVPYLLVPILFGVNTLVIDGYVTKFNMISLLIQGELPRHGVAGADPWW